ncbi:MAG: Hsp20/alpha crystallin family protein [Xanthobacteraceae bacterium]|nr:Hsp20/alpha crystallin family protein [Xanthobacteraceae bacterium]
MAEAVTKLPLKTEEKPAAAPSKTQEWHPFNSLRREINQMFDQFDVGALGAPFRRTPFDVVPFWRSEALWSTAPAVDIVEKDKAYEITAELPGMDEGNIEVKFSDGMLTIKGEKEEEKEEKKKDHYLSERRYGAFQRSFGVPDGVDTDKIEASFKKGVLTVVLPKGAEPHKKEKKIAIAAK